MDRMHGWISRKDRRPVALDAVVHRGDRSEMAARLTDISDEGCRVECEGQLIIGEWIDIAVASAGQVKAQVRWALGSTAGVKFQADEET
jgi:PilZ domain